MVECLAIVTHVHSFDSNVDRDAVTITPTEYLAAFGMIAATHVLL